MKTKSRNRTALAIAVLALGTAGSIRAQEAAPTAAPAAPKDTTQAAPATERRQLPPSTNPTQRAIYPSKDQSVELQQKDQLECYYWATEQAKWDPYEAHAKYLQQTGQASDQAAATQGEAVKGAARGAVAGVAIGAIAGDAGTGAAVGAAAGGMAGGMRSRRQMQAAEQQAEQAKQEFNTNLAAWERFYIACMEGRGYGVK